MSDLGSLLLRGRFVVLSTGVLKSAKDTQVDAEGGEGREEEEAQHVHQNSPPDVAVIALYHKLRRYRQKDGEWILSRSSFSLFIPRKIKIEY